MFSNKIYLKCKKSLTLPSMFVYLRYESEAEILRKIEARYTNESNDGLNQIDGIATSIKDWQRIFSPIFQGYLYDEPKYKLIDRIKLIDPSLYLLFTGTDSDKNALLDNIESSSRLKSVVNEISLLSSQKDKTDKNIDNLYPLLDIYFVRNLLQSQIRGGADILISPSVPITSSKRIDEQIEKVKEMNRVSRILLDTVFSGYSEERDLMHVLALNLSVLKNDYFDALKEAVLVNNPDHIGIRVMNLTEGNPSQIWSLLRFIKSLSESKVPVHIFNVREFGYVTFCHGSTTITTPIASDPYFWRAVSEEAPPRKGAYYHPIHMTNDTYDMLLEKTRANNYRFPCHCEICEKFEKVMKVDELYWNEFRRIHFLLVKNMELKELRETTTLKIALRDKFGRSQQTVWLPYLD